MRWNAKGKIMTSIFLVMLVLAGCGAGTSQIPGSSSTSADEGIRITAEKVEKKSLNTSLEREGEMRPVMEKEVNALIDGTVKSVQAVLGQTVEAGALLYSLDDTQLRNNLQVQAAYLEIAQLNLAAAQAGGGATRAAELQLEIAQKNHNTAKNNLTYAEVTSPVAGVVVMCDVEVGKEAREASVIIADLNKAVLTIHVGEDIIGSLSVGNEIQATAFSAPGVPLTGRVSKVNPYYYVGGRGYPVELEIDLAGTGIQPYGGVSVNIVGTFIEEVMVVPIKAISYEGETATVFVLNKDDTVALRQIQIGYTTEDSAVVTEGLREGDEVAVSGIRLLKDGMKVVVE